MEICWRGPMMRLFVRFARNWRYGDGRFAYCRWASNETTYRPHPECNFAKAYKDERLVRLVAEEPDPEMRNILTALNTAASDFAQMQSLSGDVHHDTVTGLVDGIEQLNGLDKQAIAALREAINLVREAKITVRQ